MPTSIRRKQLTDGLEVPCLTIGTVQFGLPYGLQSNAFASSQEEVNKMLDTAFQLGIISLDTATAYGDAEKKIGNWISKREEWFRSKNQGLLITTKVHDVDTISEMSLIASMKMEVDNSRRRLNIEQIPILMLHHFDEYMAHKDWFNKAFKVLKEESLIVLSGVSAYSSDDYFAIADSGLDAVQIPINILDWDRIDSGALRALESMIVFARSIYLQGLLLRTPNTLHPRLAFAIPVLEKYIELCRKYGMGQKEMAMSFVSSIPSITSIVVGCRNVQQLKDNIQVYQKTGKLNSEQMAEIHELFAGTNKRIINPVMWTRK